jgi:hypothetical protein
VSAVALDALLLGIRAAVDELVDSGGLIDQLADLLPERSQSPDVMTGHRPPSSRPPWDGRAADAFTAIHAAARDLEADLGGYVHGRYARRASGSDAHTRAALRQVVILVEHPAVPESEVRWIARCLGRLVRLAQAVPAIDLAPALPAMLRPPCPYCGQGTLQAAPDGSTEIVCANPDCTEPATGARPRWPKHRWPHLLSQLTTGPR